MVNDKIIEKAYEYGFEKVTFRGLWHGYKVYEPGYFDNLIHDTGYPQFLLAKGENIRWTGTSEESLEILVSINKKPRAKST